MPGERKSGVMIVMPRGVAITGHVDTSGKALSGVAVTTSENEGGPIPGGVRRMITARFAAPPRTRRSSAPAATASS